MLPQEENLIMDNFLEKPTLLKTHLNFIASVFFITVILIIIKPVIYRNLNSIYVHWGVAASTEDVKIPILTSSGCNLHDVPFLTKHNIGELTQVLDQSCLDQLSIKAVQLGRHHVNDDKLSLLYYSVATELNKTNADAWFYLGMATIKYGATSAIPLFENALSNIENATIGKSRILTRMAEILILTQSPKDWQVITEMIEEALSIDDFNDGITEKALAYYYLGEYYRQNNQADTAISYYENSIKISDKSYWAYIKLAELLYQSNEDISVCGCSSDSCKRAEQLLLHAIELKPDRVYAFNALGAYYEFYQDLFAAINMYKRSIDIDQESNPGLAKRITTLEESLLNGQQCRGKSPLSRAR